MAEKENVQNWWRKCQGKVAYGERFNLFLPQTFMNLSGIAVSRLVATFSLELGDLLIVHDDLDLPLGEIRFKQGGSSGGHQGLHSILNQLGTNRFPRLRFGIGRNPAGINAENYVLQPFSPQEEAMLSQLVELAASGIEIWVTQGIVAAMNLFNRKQLLEN